ncbi:MAG: stage V sporulation protein AD [Bacilli bacterium]|nr:stage V sporulation protein AD [Bacilli bacterium]MDD4809376.1 stage V sporulation protein AD [Bacilli bacterium]
MTFKYNSVYINAVSTITGPYESKGPLSKYYDKSYDDLYFGTKTWEQAETKLIEESVDSLLTKIGKTKFDINLLISGDLLNQIVASNYAASSLGIPFLGIYSACASSIEGLIIGANMIEANQIKNCVCSVSSHNNAAEKQFRYPIEYGGPKRKTATFTSTGSASAYLTYNKKGIKIESATVGIVNDNGIKDIFHTGAIMAPAAADTIYRHLNDMKREVGYYDLILTGDLGMIGKEILKEYIEVEYGIKLNNYDDAACMIYDINSQPVYAGASGSACLPLVAYGYIFSKMKKKELHRILLVGTGALMSPTMVNQKLSIPGIAHAISLEVVE